MDLTYTKVVIKEGTEPLLRRVKCLAEQTFQRLSISLLKKPHLIIFDYDNTLVDSWPQDFETSNEALKELGLSPMDAIEMLQLPHVPAVTALVEATGLPYETVKTTYNRIYDRIHQELAPPLPGAERLLEKLQDMGILTAVISNKEHDLLHNTLERIGWTKYFNTFYGAHKNKPYKPDPKVIDEITNILPYPISRKNIFFVGDALSTDISCALRGGVTPIWMSQYSVDEVEFGIHGPEIIHSENCLTLCEILNVWT